jgi:hypothetical protein
MTVARFVVACALTLFMVSGCAKKNYLNENDALRAQVIDLQKQIADLQRRSEELEVQVRQATAAASGDVSEEVKLATPHPVAINIDRLSHVQPQKDGSTGPGRLVVYVDCVDGRGRAVQLVGDVEITAFRLPLETEPSIIGRFTASPLQVSEAYRSSLMGTHYTFEVPLSITLPSPTSGAGGGDTVFVKVQFTDGVTGIVLTAERSLH